MTAFANVSGISTILPDPHLIWAAFLDTPTAGQQVDARAVPIVGWVIPVDGPPRAVELLVAGEIVERVVVNEARPDLAQAFPEVEHAGAGGYRTAVNLLAATSDVELEVRAVLPGGDRSSLATIRLDPAWRRMTAEPPVSVIIACHDQGHFLGEAIESVLAQTHENLEIVVVDDGSRDNTFRVAGRYAGVRRIQQSHAGAAAARNAGMREAAGDYVVFLDADDRLLPEALATGAAWLDRHPDHGFATGRWEVIDSVGAALSTPEQPPLEEDAYEALLRHYNFVMIAATMFRRDVVAGVGGFDTALRACEDYDLLLRIAARGPIGWHGRTVAQYRRHGRNTTRNAALMLRSTMHVLRRQQARAAMTEQGRKAYQIGRAARAENFGPPLVAEVRRQVARREWLAAARGISVLLRHYPTGIGRVASTVVPGSTASAPPEPVEEAAELAPTPGRVDFGSLRRTVPISSVWGLDRGRPIDRYYVERFLERHAADVHGAVLEIGDDTYTRRFGQGVTSSDVLHVTPGQPQATITADLAAGDGLPSEAFDCVILTQTLQLIYDVRAAVATVHRILKPGGVLLATAPGLTQTTGDEWHGSWYWRFTPLSARRLLCEVFPEESVQVDAFGNVLAAISFLQGLAAEELRPEELDQAEPGYDVSITMRAVRPAHEDPRKP